LHQAVITSAYLRAFAISAKSFRKGSWFVGVSPTEVYLFDISAAFSGG
jgi:hypothetical protein